MVKNTGYGNAAGRGRHDFLLVDCLPGEYQMNSIRTNEGGYEESDLRKKLNGEILNLFPVELTDMMIPFDNGDLLRRRLRKRFSEKTATGEYESPYVKQWKPMKKRRNRMAFDGSKNENLQWYWLMNKVRESVSGFSGGGSIGRADCRSSSSFGGVRPAFKIKIKNQSMTND